MADRAEPHTGIKLSNNPGSPTVSAFVSAGAAAAASGSFSGFASGAEVGGAADDCGGSTRSSFSLKPPQSGFNSSQAVGGGGVRGPNVTPPPLTVTPNPCNWGGWVGSSDWVPAGSLFRVGLFRAYP